MLHLTKFKKETPFCFIPCPRNHVIFISFSVLILIYYIKSRVLIHSLTHSLTDNAQPKPLDRFRPNFYSGFLFRRRLPLRRGFSKFRPQRGQKGLQSFRPFWKPIELETWNSVKTLFKQIESTPISGIFDSSPRGLEKGGLISVSACKARTTTFLLV